MITTSLLVNETGCYIVFVSKKMKIKIFHNYISVGVVVEIN